MAEVLVAGLSARALSVSARQAGYLPLAADFFADLDTREIAVDCVQVEGDLDRGFEPAPLLAALDRLAEGREPIGAVCGAGFEDRPALLAAIAARWRLIGNSAEAVAQAKDPEGLAERCRRLGIPHPRISVERQGEGWLVKRRAGAGGAHVAAGGSSPVASEGGGSKPALCERSPPDGAIYWQERVGGEGVSALVLAAEEEALVLGLSAQWADPLPQAPFRYGGAVRPAALSQATEAGLTEAARDIAAAYGLVGLNSVDFLVAEDDWHLIEVNPRPGATLDIFATERGRLFGLHVDACCGRRPAQAPAFAGAAAMRTVYARRAIACVPAFAWPDWAADRQPAGTAVAAGAPLCTVLAQAERADDARRLAERRGDAILAALGARGEWASA